MKACGFSACLHKYIGERFLSESGFHCHERFRNSVGVLAWAKAECDAPCEEHGSNIANILIKCKTKRLEAKVADCDCPIDELIEQSFYQIETNSREIAIPMTICTVSEYNRKAINEASILK